MKTYFLRIVAFSVAIFLMNGCRQIMVAKAKIGREFPGMNEKTFKKISKETKIPISSFVLPDRQAFREINQQLSTNDAALPFVYLLNEKREQVVLPDTLSKNQCPGLLQKYLVKGVRSESDGTPKKGRFYSVTDSSEVDYIPGKNYIVLVYIYEMGKINNDFYRSIQQLASNPEKNLQLFLVMLNGVLKPKSD